MWGLDEKSQFIKDLKDTRTHTHTHADCEQQFMYIITERQLSTGEMSMKDDLMDQCDAIARITFTK